MSNSFSKRICKHSTCRLSSCLSLLYFPLSVCFLTPSFRLRPLLWAVAFAPLAPGEWPVYIGCHKNQAAQCPISKADVDHKRELCIELWVFRTVKQNLKLRRVLRRVCAEEYAQICTEEYRACRAYFAHFAKAVTPNPLLCSGSLYELESRRICSPGKPSPARTGGKCAELRKLGKLDRSLQIKQKSKLKKLLKHSEDSEVDSGSHRKVQQEIETKLSQDFTHGNESCTVRRNSFNIVSVSTFDACRRLGFQFKVSVLKSNHYRPPSKSTFRRCRWWCRDMQRFKFETRAFNTFQWFFNVWPGYLVAGDRTALAPNADFWLWLHCSDRFFGFSAASSTKWIEVHGCWFVYCVQEYTRTYTIRTYSNIFINLLICLLSRYTHVM